MLDFILDPINEFIRDMLKGWIEDNLSDLFVQLNNNVALWGYCPAEKLARACSEPGVSVSRTQLINITTLCANIFSKKNAFSCVFA